MSDHLTFQRTPSQFALFMLGPAALAAWLDDDSQPFEKMYMPCGAGLMGIGVSASAPLSGAGEGNCPWAVGESAKDASANAGNTIKKRRAHARFRISTQNTWLKTIFCLYMTERLSRLDEYSFNC